VYRRVCAKCHAPSGDAIDLSTAAAWRDHRGDLRLRVVDTRTMPPAGTPISDADRQALATWLR
jgi:mono/diheme cytochrome c family protein